MNNEMKLNYALLFGGGAIRGIAYCGAIKALNELNVEADIIAGSSVGSIIAGLMAVGYSPAEITDIIMQVNFELFRDLNLTLGSQFALSKGEVFLEWVRDLVEKKYYGENYKKGTHKSVTFRDIEKSLVIITTDLSNFECKEFSKFETPDFEIAKAIRISCSMPGLMKPVEYNNRVLVDGDLQKSVPMWKLSKNLQPKNERILEFRLEGDFEGKDKNAIEYLNSIYSYATCTGTHFITELYGCCDKYDYIVINTGDLNIVDFNISDNKRDQLFQIGYNKTLSYFEDVLFSKKKMLFELYSNMKKYLDNIEASLKANKILQVKGFTGELFMHICDRVNNIDDEDYALLVQFRDILLENIKYPALFGRTSLQNANLVNATFNLCKSKINNKIEGFSEYINAYSE